MPYLDNLYSAGDSDTESFSDELSPTDGYFTNRDHPQDVMVPDPTTGSNNAKAQEARAEAQANSESHVLRGQTLSVMPISSLPASLGTRSATYTPTSFTAYAPREFTSALTRQENLYSEASPLLPPPAYSATTSQLGDQNFIGNYSTISAQRLEEGNREPESMGQANEHNEGVSLWKRKARNLFQSLSLRRLLLITFILGLAIGVLMIAAHFSKSNYGKDFPPGKSPPPRPGVEHESYCTSAKIHSSDRLPTYRFTSGESLAVLQVTQNIRRGSASVSTAGEIILRRLPEKEGIQQTGYITFDIWLSDPSLRYGFQMDAEMQVLKVTTPGSADLIPNGHHCISLQVSVWVPLNATFNELMIELTKLSLRVLDDLDLNISQTSKFVSYSGNVHFPPGNGSVFNGTPEKSLELGDDETPLERVGGFSSREIHVGTTSGDITGDFRLWDLLHVESNSGKIHIFITPEPVLEDDPKPAQLILATASGDIKAQLPIWQVSSILDREYHTRINTHSGAIQADIVIGTEAVIRSVSGSLAITALPTADANSIFTTGTESGDTVITVLCPLSAGGSYDHPSEDFTDIGNDNPYLIGHLDHSKITHAAQLRESPRSLLRLVSQHDGGSGSVKMRYPSAWESEINAENVSGSIMVGGNGVRIVKDSRKNWAYHEVVARKGAAAKYASFLGVREISGDIEVWIG